jgi:hypothetical protein
MARSHGGAKNKLLLLVAIMEAPTKDGGYWLGEQSAPAILL